MKKFLSSLMAIMVVSLVSVSFVSCGDDDIEEVFGPEGFKKEVLMGTWDFLSGEEDVMGQHVSMTRESLADMKAQMSSMAGVRVEFWDETLIFGENLVNGVQYSVSGTTLKLKDMPSGCEIKFKELTATKLVLHETIDLKKMARSLGVEDALNGVDVGVIEAEMVYKKR